MSETSTYTSYTSTTTYQPVVTPPPPPKPETYSTQAAAQTAKGVVSFNTALQDLQTLDNKGIQNRYNMSRPEFERAVKQLEQQVSGQRVDNAQQSEASWDFTGRVKNNAHVNFSLLEQSEDLSGLSPKQRQAEMSTRADIALNVYSLLKKQGQDVGRIAIRRSSDDPRRYNVTIETPNGLGGKDQQTIQNVDPERLGQLPKMMGQETPAQQSGQASIYDPRTVNINISLTQIFHGPNARQEAIDALMKTADEHGYALEFPKGTEPPSIPLRDTIEYRMLPKNGNDSVPMEGNIDITTMSNEDMRPTMEGMVKTAGRISDESRKAGRILEKISLFISGKGEFAATAHLADGTQKYYEGNFSDGSFREVEGGKGAEGEKSMAPQPRTDYSQFAYRSDPYEKSQAATSGYYDYNQQNHWLELAKIINDARSYINQMVNQGPTEEERIAEEKAAERRHEEKQAEKAAAAKQQAAKEAAEHEAEKAAAERSTEAIREARQIKNRIDTTLFSRDPMDNEDLELKALHLEQESRRG